MTESNLSAADILDRIQAAINNTDTTIAGYLLSWLNDKYFVVLNRNKEWPFLQKEGRSTLTFTSAAPTTTLPSDFKSMIETYDETNNKKLFRTELWKVRKNDPDISDSSSTPTHYYFTAEEGPSKTIGIFPAPASGVTITLSIIYQIELTPLTDSGTSVPLLPNRHRANVLVPGVVAEYYRWKQQFDKAGVYDQQFESSITRMEIEQGIIKQNADEDWQWRWDDRIGIEPTDTQ
jgi:hypothetical protein